jgi:hypothetical protein
MAEWRALRKGIVKSKKISGICKKLHCLEPAVLYVFFIPHLDINGVYENDIDLIRSTLLFRYNGEFKFSEEDIKIYLEEYSNEGLIINYEIGNKKYMWFPDFIEKQAFSQRINVPPDYPVIESLQKQIDEEWTKKMRSDKTHEKHHEKPKEQPFSPDALKIKTLWSEKHNEMVGTPIIFTKWEIENLEKLLSHKDVGYDRVIQMLRFMYQNEEWRNKWSAKFFFNNQQDILDFSKEMK